MSYESWFKNHTIKHKKLVDKLSHLSDEELIDYFDFENMRIKEIDFCPLYKDNKKCHDIEELNCYLCACPNFRVDKNKSYCSIDSKDGGSIEHNGFVHQDCSKCSIPHKKSYVRKHFNRDWHKSFSKTFLK
jgi:Zn-finger protein